MYRTRTLFILFILTFALPAAIAQVNDEDEPAPVISRVCLWNADRTTWKILGLKRSQIERMNELRQLYPAVVDGQWVSSEEPEEISGVAADHGGADPTLTTSLKVRGESTGRAGAENVSHNSVALKPAGLQSQLRSVLTPQQLRRWSKACGH